MWFGNSGRFGIHGVMWVVLVIFVVISVQWGRGRWGFPGLAGLVLVGNIFAMGAIPLLYSAGWWGSESIAMEYVDSGPGDLTGIYLDGEPVTNVFPYDAQGEPLTDVQLFTDTGQPLRATVEGADGCLDPGCNEFGLWVPRALAAGQQARNVYPMAMAPEVYSDENGADGSIRMPPSLHDRCRSRRRLHSWRLRRPNLPKRLRHPTNRIGIKSTLNSVV